MTKKIYHKPILTIVMTVIILIVVGGLLVINHSNKADPKNKVSIIFISKRLDEKNDFWSSIIEGMNMAVSEYSIELITMGPKSETLYQEQNEMIEAAIEKKPDVIALAPSSYTHTLKYARKIEAAGIKLILIDSVMEEDAGLCVVATNNFDGGHKIGEYIKTSADENTVIGIVSHIPAASTAIEREKGLRKGLGKYQKQIAAVVFSESDYDIGYQKTMEMLIDNPNMNLIIGLNEDSSVGAAMAVKELKLTHKVKVIGFDSSMKQIQLLEEGVFDAIMVQKPLNMGYLGIKMAYQAAIDKPVAQMVDSGSNLITRENIYTKENEKLLFPFKSSNYK
jgi:ribose transport system substrate-binding protein